MSSPSPQANPVASGLPNQTAVFAPTPEGAQSVGNFVAAAVRAAGLGWEADRSALAAYLQGLRLLRTGHPSGPISALASYFEAARLVQIQVGDGGIVLPDQQEKGLLHVALAEYVDRHWAANTASGRELVCEFTVRRAYRIRTTWRRAEPGPGVHAYAEFDGAEEAAGALTQAAASIGAVDERGELLAVHLQGPVDSHGSWTGILPVPATPGAGAGFHAVEPEPPLPLAELAEVTKAALRACSFDWAWRRETAPRDLPGLVRAALPQARLSAARVRQFARWVADAAAASGPDIGDPLLSLVASSHSDPLGPLAGLQRRLGSAWMACEELRMQAPARPRRDSSEPVDLLTLSGRLTLVTRDRRTGRQLLAPEVCGLGIAGAVLAEAVLAGHLTIAADEASPGTLAWTESEETSGMSQAAADLVATVRVEEPMEVARWLDYLALTAAGQVESALVDSGVLVPEAAAARRRWARTAVPVLPARPALVDRVVRLASFPEHSPDEHLRVENAVLLALVYATGLHHADRNTWWMAEDAKANDGLDDAGPDITRLIEHVADAVTTAVAARRR